MKRIAIDMDEVIADFTSKLLRVYNHTFNESLSVQDLQGERLWTIRPKLSKQILSLVDESDFFSDLEVMEGSQEVIRELSNHFEVVYCDSSYGTPYIVYREIQLAERTFPIFAGKELCVLWK